MNLAAVTPDLAPPGRSLAPESPAEWVFEARGVTKHYDDRSGPGVGGWISASRRVNLWRSPVRAAAANPRSSSCSTRSTARAGASFSTGGSRWPACRTRRPTGPGRSGSSSRLFTCCRPSPRWRTCRCDVRDGSLPTRAPRPRGRTARRGRPGPPARPFPGKLSGGERQRVAIARSLANGPGILLADEPTAISTRKNARAVLELIVRLQREHRMTLILVTHDPQVARYAARAIHLTDGRIVSDTAPDTRAAAAAGSVP